MELSWQIFIDFFNVCRGLFESSVAIYGLGYILIAKINRI